MISSSLTSEYLGIRHTSQTQCLNLQILRENFQELELSSLILVEMRTMLLVRVENTSLIVSIGILELYSSCCLWPCFPIVPLLILRSLGRICLLLCSLGSQASQTLHSFIQVDPLSRYPLLLLFL